MALLEDLNILLAKSDTQQQMKTPVAAEFMTLMSLALRDEDDGIRSTGSLVAEALREKARGWLAQEDIVILLEGQRDIARIRANNAQIALRNRIQSIVIRMIDLALISLLGIL